MDRQELKILTLGPPTPSLGLFLKEKIFNFLPDFLRFGQTVKIVAISCPKIIKPFRPLLFCCS